VLLLSGPSSISTTLRPGGGEQFGGDAGTRPMMAGSSAGHDFQVPPSRIGQ
jgi:hypothetical protein